MLDFNFEAMLNERNKVNLMCLLIVVVYIRSDLIFRRSN